jgi:OTU domain-containing protein 6
MSRYEKRKAKKLAEEAEADRLRAEAEGDVEAKREVEKRQLQRELEPLGLTFEDIRADGHCLFTSVAHQLALRSGEQIQRGAHMEIRQIATTHMRANPTQYQPFVEGDFEAYCSRMASSSDWGGQIEIQALADALKTPIEVYAANQAKTTMGEVFGEQGLEPLRVSYHRQYYALGEHYNSVVPVGKVGAAGRAGGL